MAQYYSIRQLNPYRGVVQIIAAGNTQALSVDGVHWHARSQSIAGRYYSVGGFNDEENRLIDFSERGVLLEAFHHRPATPFTLEDNTELWLLNKDTGLPLALLASKRSGEPSTQDAYPTWLSFNLRDNSFVAESLKARDALRDKRAWPEPHREIINNLINHAARPYPAAQWFKRHDDRSGEGLAGVRVVAEWEGRLLSPEDFPELLLEEKWLNTENAQLVKEYHEQVAPDLLTHPYLLRATRESLEWAAAAQPEKLLQIYRLIPEFVNREEVEVALVKARLMMA
ncbi:hypothetical protein [Sulfurirhabdus autotrophica]|uniref:Uncharacterized protein n=1 Tax=Sulfurirhabdus autotrophica TaxID=1706046 RepID=A0A4R3Y8D7_9PROT|nr:hypothetical protein [Sulfurirhabdus autotrophica]TCV88167.1 hypothetical protein EDC63_104124 [Sulfurirhabdus autotrophica]